MIRLILILLLTGCVNVDYSYFGYLKNSLERERIEINQEVIDASSYSFIKVNFMRREATFILSSIDKNNVMRWIGTNGEVIQTLDGIIVSIGGFGPSFEILNVMDLGLLVKENTSYKVNFYNPQLFNVEVKTYISNNSTKDFIEVNKSIDFLSWSKKDKYYFSEGTLTKTKQFVSPLYGPISIDFLLRILEKTAAMPLFFKDG